MRVVFDGLGEDDSKELIIPPIQPIDATIGSNGYNLADTFELAFHADHLPISPELIRAIGVEIYLFQTAQFEEDPSAFLKEENRIIAGIADESTLDYSSSGRVVRVSGRDYTGLLLDKKWPATDPFSPDSDLKQAVQSVLNKFHKANSSRGIKLTAEYAEDSKGAHVQKIGAGITTKKTAKPKKATKSGRSKSTKKRAPPKSDRTYWDLIYELCLSYGYIAYVQGEEVIIHEPQSLSDEVKHSALHYAFGHNLASLQIARKLSNHAAPQVVSSFCDPKSKKHVEVKFPSDKQAKKNGAGGDSIQFRRIAPPRGIADEETLKRYLSAAYHQYGRSESSVKFSTKALRGLEQPESAAYLAQDETDPRSANNILRLRAGRPVAIGWDSVGEQDMREKSSAQRVLTLKDRGYSDQVAQLVADNYDKLDSLRRPFYTKVATFSWSNESGLSVDVEAINYIDPNRDSKKT